MKTFVIVALASLALAGCKKDDKPGTAAGSAAVGSGSAGASMAGSNTLAGSGEGTMTGSGSSMAGSGSATTDATPPRPATVTDPMLATADKAAAAIESLVNELDAAKADCTKTMDVVKKRDAELAGIAKEVDAARTITDKDPAAKAWMNSYMKTKLAPSVGKMIAVAGTCKDIAPVLKAHPLFKKSADAAAADDQKAADDHKGHGH